MHYAFSYKNVERARHKRNISIRIDELMKQKLVQQNQASQGKIFNSKIDGVKKMNRKKCDVNSFVT